MSYVSWCLFIFLFKKEIMLNMTLVYFQSGFSHWEREHVILRLFLQVCKGVIEGLLSGKKKWFTIAYSNYVVQFTVGDHHCLGKYVGCGESNASRL